MAINYTGVDLDRYNAGNKFYSQDRYLQGIGLDKPAITFNPSNSNTGIMSQYPKYPIIPQSGGDGDGGGPFGPRGNSKFDYEYEALGGLYNKDNVPLTEEEQKTLNRQKTIDTLKSIGKFGLMTMSPFGPINTYGIGKGINKVKDIFSGDGNTNNMGNLSQSGTYGGNATYSSDGSSVDSSTGDITGSDGTSQGNINDEFAYGGRAGYSGGGLSGYEIVKLGELGYNTKGGTVLEPFGGIKVLRDILKVNKYAYGGRAGYRDGGYSSEDNEEQQAQDQASFDAGNRTDDYNDMYSGDGGDNNNFVNNINIPTGTSNLDFSMVKNINPAFSYANNIGRFGGVLDTTRTIKEEEPVGTMDYFSPSGNFGIGLDTKKGMSANYMFDGDAGRLGATYGKDGFNLGLSYNKKFNNGGIVGMYR